MLENIILVKIVEDKKTVSTKLERLLTRGIKEELYSFSNEKKIVNSRHLDHDVTTNY